MRSIIPRTARTLITQEKASKKSSQQERGTLCKKLEFYRDRVLNTDLRNRSILLRTINDKWFFDLATVGSGTKVVEHALIDRKSVCIIPNSDRSLAAERQRISLGKLYRNITQIQREIGREETYLGFPFLVGHFSDHVYVRGPLVLFPASIRYRQQGKPVGWYIVFSEDKDPILNRALMQIIKKYTGLPPDALEKDFEKLLKALEEGQAKEEYSVESRFLKGLVDDVLLRNDFLIEYSSDIGENKILNKINVTDGRVSLDEKKSWIGNENPYLANFKVIGNFPQGENAIYLDYEDMIKKAEDSSEDFGIIKKLLGDEDISSDANIISQHIEDKEAEPIKLDEIPSDKLKLAIASDASQDNVVLMSQSNDCIVVRGPPGTGKSQVIVNLISNALAKQQKVLLICDKKDPLEVVYNRLDKVGLSDHLAPLYDTKNQSSLYKKFSSILESKRSSEDINRINKRFLDCSHEIDELIDKQNRIVNALKDETIAGIPVNILYALSNSSYIRRLNLSGIAQEIQYHTLPRLLDNVKNLEHNCKRFDSPDFPWAYRRNFYNLSFNDKYTLVKIIDRIIDLCDEKEDIIFILNVSDQKTLIHALDSLMNSGGMLRKLLLGGKERAARDNVKRLLNQSSIPDDINSIKDLSRRAKAGLQLWETINELLIFVSEEGIDQLSRQLANGGGVAGNRDSFLSKLTKMQESLESFDDLQAYDKRKAELSPKEREILKIYLASLSTENGWHEILEQEFYLYWIEYIEQKYPDLKGQPFEAYMTNRNQLSKLINEHRKLVVQKISNQINSSIMRPEITSRPSHLYKAQYNQWNTLLSELNKRRHVLPIRKVLEKYESIIMKIAPCWLATPPVVSAIFPLERTLFDYIIFDEASQIHVAESLPALERGKNLVVIGDEKQLPPINHFRIKDAEDSASEGGDDEDIDRALLSESLLALTNRFFSHTYLTWHYRSVHQELIDFSNNAFYDGRLKVAPNTSKDTAPIRWISCNNGSWVERKNKPEAIRVVDELKSILLKNKVEQLHHSVGIITLNYLQQEEIRDEIDRRIQQDPEFGELYSSADNQEKNMLSDLPFVRNIERVQGEERDIIIFSTGYAKDLTNKEDTIGVQFGSLNHTDGEHYLNVAITRARHQIIIVCSFDPYRINVEDATHNGPRTFKNYLCFAKAISESDAQAAKKILSSLHFEKPEKIGKFNDFDEHLEKLVSSELQKLGYKIDLHVGHSDYKIDLAVIHPDFPSKYILAIEFDGTSFLSAESTRERDITRQEFLKSKGWTVEWIWSRNWWRNPNKEINRIHQKIQELRQLKSPGI